VSPSGKLIVIWERKRTDTEQIWSTIISREGKWQLELIHRLDHRDRSWANGKNYASAITSVLPAKRHVYTGDKEGHVVSKSVNSTICSSDRFTVSVGLRPMTL